ncbi:MAG TPA: polysaccharide pyruvyl transferase family protein, partial [Candidatus Babeliaceae bacterium]|nr:polysaccharide pyruvyl transferase family protein [Candidatus Babeliaceae bacterium]
KMASLNREVNIEDIDLDRKKTFIGLPFDYARHLNFFRPQQTALNNYEIIRVHQDFSTHYYHIKFSHPNSFMSYNPLSYLSIYKSAAFTISDRVHACAVSLAFGKPARFMSATPRAGIFDRLGFNNKNSKGIMYPNSEVIDMEYDKLTKEIKKYF